MSSAVVHNSASKTTLNSYTYLVSHMHIELKTNQAGLLMLYKQACKQASLCNGVLTLVSCQLWCIPLIPGQAEAGRFHDFKGSLVYR